MDLHLKQWRDQHESEEQLSSPAKIPKLTLNPPPHSDPSALALFVPQHPNTKLTQLSAPPDSTSAGNKFPRMGGGFFSLAQWQELELQALIFRHMIAGAAIPPELLQPIIKKSILQNTATPYYLHHSLLQHYPHFEPALLQSGYWGKAALDPEPGRCRRTDGKKWRCSRDVVTGHKYCERHLNRGRNRSRKPVEIATTANGSGCAAAPTNAAAFGPKTAVGSSGGTPFALSEPLPANNLFHLDQSCRSSVPEMGKGLPVTNDEASRNVKSDGQVLRHFFDDWPRSLQEADNASTAGNSATCLAISIPGNPSSDTSLKLSTGNREELTAAGPQRQALNWAEGWGTNQAPSMGGPLAEALRSPVPNSSSPSPTSVLHQLSRSTGLSETSYVST